jgi:hypothetical protein
MVSQMPITLSSLSVMRAYQSGKMLINLPFIAFLLPGRHIGDYVISMSPEEKRLEWLRNLLVQEERRKESGRLRENS